MQRKLFVPRATKVLLERPAEWEKKREEGNFSGLKPDFGVCRPRFSKKQI